MAIAFVQTIGTAFNNAAGSVSVTVPVSGVPAGHTLIACSLAGDSVSGNNTTQQISDSRANSYQTDLHTYDGTTINEALQIASCNVVTPLLSGDTITLTITVAGGTNPFGSLAVYEFSGLATNSWLDQTASALNTAGSTSADSGATAATSLANELVFGNFRGASGTTWTQGAGYTALSTVASSRDSLFGEYKIVSATGAQDATATLSGSAKWIAQCVTYKGVSGLNNLLLLGA